jgi:Fur family iron response transcriptional regulator
MKHEKINSNKNVNEMLLESGIKLTQQRIEIANFLFKKQQHVCAEQILSTLNQGVSHVSKATVYNTLGLFASKGLLREVIIDPNKAFYDTNTEHHHHFYNTSTNDLTDIEHNDVVIDKLPELPKGTNIQSVDVIIKVSNQ